MSIDVDALREALRTYRLDATLGDNINRGSWQRPDSRDAAAIAREYDRLAPADTGLREAAQAVVNGWPRLNDQLMQPRIDALRAALDAEAGR